MPPAQLALAGLCGALTLVLAYEIAAPIPPFDAPKSAELYRSAAITFQDTANAPSAASFGDIDAHPIFSASRTPVAAQIDVTRGGTSSTFPTDISLIGVIIEGQTRLALVKSAGEPFARSVAQGGEIDGWTVAEVDADKIVVSSGATKREILLATNRASESGLSVNAGAASGAGMVPISPPNPVVAPSAPIGAGAGTTVPIPGVAAPGAPPSVSPKPPPDNPSPAPHQ